MQKRGKAGCLCDQQDLYKIVVFVNCEQIQIFVELWLDVKFDIMVKHWRGLKLSIASNSGNMGSKYVRLLFYQSFLWNLHGVEMLNFGIMWIWNHMAWKCIKLYGAAWAQAAYWAVDEIWGVLKLQQSCHILAMLLCGGDFIIGSG